MSKPIEGCPVEEKPIRERAWTAEQAHLQLMTKLLNIKTQAASAMTQDEYTAAGEKAIRALPEIIATLRQQGERGDGVVSDEACAMLRRKLPLGCAGMVGNDEARAALEAVAPLLRAPAEQGGSVDGRVASRDLIDAVQASVSRFEARRKVACERHGGWRWESEEDRLAYERLVAALTTALAQSTQGDKPVAWCAGLDATVYGFIDAKAWKEGEFTTPLYLHAERARVPDGWRETIREAIDCIADVERFKGNLKIGVYRHIGEKLNAFLAAAPSQPEDAA